MNKLLNEIIDFGEPYGVTAKRSGHFISLFPVGQKKLILLTFSEERFDAENIDRTTVRIQQHRTKELTTLYQLKKVSVKWLKKFIINFSNIKDASLSEYQSKVDYEEQLRQENLQRQELARQHIKAQEEESKKRIIDVSSSSYNDRQALKERNPTH